MTSPKRVTPPRRHGDRTLERRQVVPRGIEETFAFFAEPSNLEAITPGWLRFEILDAPPELRTGALLRYRLRLFGIPVGWRTEITHWRPPRTFTDTQLAGPYRRWIHTHRFSPVRGGTEIYDHVAFVVPGGPLARPVHALAVGPWLDEIFDFRARRLHELLGGLVSN